MASRSLHSAELRQQARCQLAEGDPVMARLVERYGEVWPKLKRRSRFDLLAGIILGQQISTAAARTIRGRLLARLGGPPTAEALLELEVDAMRELGISRQKAGYLHDLARAVQEGGLPLRRLGHMDEREVREAITAVKGLGPWSAEMFLMFGLGHPDILSPGDLGLQNAAVQQYGLRKRPRPDRFERLARPWRPWRTYACLYLWRSLEQGGPADGA